MNKQTASIVQAMGKIQQQMATARVVGKIATQFGSREISKTFRNFLGAVTDTTVKPREAATNTGPDDTGSDLAIANYTTLSALDIVAQLGFLSADELRAVAVFENAHRMRQTILFKIDQLLQT